MPLKIAREQTVVSDGDLWARLRERDVESFEALYSRYGSYVYALSLRMLARSEEAEEVVQDVFWQLWKSQVSYDPARGGFRTWLFAITRSRCLDRLRKRPRDPAEELPPARSGAPDPERSAYLAELQRRVVAALEELPKPQRVALELGFFGGMTHQEIADRLGEPLGTVKSRIKMGMDKLKVSLQSLEES